MAAKKILFDAQAREAVRRGIEKLAHAVKVTLQKLRGLLQGYTQRFGRIGQEMLFKSVHYLPPRAPHY